MCSSLPEYRSSIRLCRKSRNPKKPKAKSSLKVAIARPICHNVARSAGHAGLQTVPVFAAAEAWCIRQQGLSKALKVQPWQPANDNSLGGVAVAEAQ